MNCMVCGAPTSGRLGRVVDGNPVQDPDGMPVCFDCYENRPADVHAKIKEFEENK